MKKVAVTAIFSVIATTLIVIFIYLILNILKEEKLISSTDISKLIEKPELQNIKNKLSPWFTKLAKQKTPDFMPMSNELYIHFELANAGHSSKKKFFKLSIDKEDSYSLFCVKQSVAKLDLKYFFVNTKRNAKIIIDTTDVSMLHRLVDILKGYRIGSTFEEIWI